MRLHTCVRALDVAEVMGRRSSPWRRESPEAAAAGQALRRHRSGISEVSRYHAAIRCGVE